MGSFSRKVKKIFSKIGRKLHIRRNGKVAAEKRPKVTLVPVEYVEPRPCGLPNNFGIVGGKLLVSMESYRHYENQIYLATLKMQEYNQMIKKGMTHQQAVNFQNTEYLHWLADLDQAVEEEEQRAKETDSDYSKSYPYDSEEELDGTTEGVQEMAHPRDLVSVPSEPAEVVVGHVRDESLIEQESSGNGNADVKVTSTVDDEHATSIVDVGKEIDTGAATAKPTETVASIDQPKEIESAEAINQDESSNEALIVDEEQIAPTVNNDVTSSDTSNVATESQASTADDAEDEALQNSPFFSWCPKEMRRVPEGLQRFTDKGTPMYVFFSPGGLGKVPTNKSFSNEYINEKIEEYLEKKLYLEFKYGHEFPYNWNNEYMGRPTGFVDSVVQEREELFNGITLENITDIHRNIIIREYVFHKVDPDSYITEHLDEFHRFMRENRNFTVTFERIQFRTP